MPHAVAECELMRKEVDDRKLREKIFTVLLTPMFKPELAVRVGDMVSSDVSTSGFDELVKVLNRGDENLLSRHRSQLTVAMQDVFVCVADHRYALIEVLKANESLAELESTAVLHTKLEDAGLELKRVVSSIGSLEHEQVDQIKSQLTGDVDYSEQELSEMRRIRCLRAALDSGCAVGPPESFQTSAIVLSHLETVTGVYRPSGISLSKPENEDAASKENFASQQETQGAILHSSCLSPPSAFLLTLVLWYSHMTLYRQ